MTDKQNKQSFVMYASFYDAAMGLNDEDFREYILALKDYALFGIEHTSQNSMVNGLLTMAQPNLDAAAKRREKQVKNGEYGNLGGRPRKGETAAEYKARKEALRYSFNTSKTQVNPMGFQTKTLNVDVDVNSAVKEDDNWNEEGNVDIKENENLNEELNANGNADKDEKDKVCKDSSLLNPNSSSSLKTELHPSQLHSEKTAFESEYYFNDDDYNESTGNCLGTIEDIKRRSSLPEDSEIVFEETSTASIEEGKMFSPSMEKVSEIMQRQRTIVIGKKTKILEEEEDYCDGAYAIISDDLSVLRRCFIYYWAGSGKRDAAQNKIHELIMSQSPKSEEAYIQIVRDLWEFYIRDKAYWDSKANTKYDSFNPYLDDKG